MAVNTANRRFSMIGLGSPVPSVLPVPDGSLAHVNDRYQLMWLYRILPDVLEPGICLTLNTRSLALSAQARSLELDLHSRTLALSVRGRRGSCN